MRLREEIEDPDSFAKGERNLCKRAPRLLLPRDIDRVRDNTALFNSGVGGDQKLQMNTSVPPPVVKKPGQDVVAGMVTNDPRM